MAMIDAAEEEGLVEPGRSVIVEPTSGNTGIALAMVCAARGYELILTLPEGMSRERAKLLRAYGAEVRETPSLGGMGEAVELAEEIREQRRAFMPQQFSNPANPEVHRRTTAEEIWRDTDGAGRRLRRRGRHRRHDHRRRGGCCGSARPRRWSSRSSRRARRCSRGGEPGPHKIQGIGAGFVPEVLDRSVIDEVISVSDEEALETARLAARARASSPASRPGRTSGRRSRSRRGRRWRASGWSRSSATRASATCPCPSSHRDEHDEAGHPGGPFGRRGGARSRPGRAGGLTLEILTSWAGVQALLAHRVAHAMLEAGMPLAPRAIAYLTRAFTGVEIHPAAQDRRRVLHRPWLGRRDRRDG